MLHWTQNASYEELCNRPRGELHQARAELVEGVLGLEAQLKDPDRLNEYWRKQARYALANKRAALHRVNAAIKAANKADYVNRLGLLMPLSQQLVGALRVRGIDDPEVARLSADIERVVAGGPVTPLAL